MLRVFWRAQGMPETIVSLWAAEGFASPLDVAQSFVDLADLRGTLPEGIPADHAESAVDFYVGAVRDKGAAIQRMAGTLPRGTLTEGSLPLTSGGRIAASTSLHREPLLPVRIERPQAVPNGRALGSKPGRGGWFHRSARVKRMENCLLAPLRRPVVAKTEPEQLEDGLEEFYVIYKSLGPLGKRWSEPSEGWRVHRDLFTRPLQDADPTTLRQALSTLRR